ncbi:neuron navigator 2-like isoform X2, partial [Clarias magur]
IENIDACLGFLAAKGVNIKGLCAEEIRSGNLKAILGLFFSLSRYKQQQQNATLKQANDETRVLQTARVRSASPAQTHSPWCTSHATPCTVHIHEHEEHNTGASVLKTQEDMQSKLPGPLIQPRRSGSRRSQSFIHRDESKSQMLSCTQHTDKSSPSPVIMVDQGPPSSPILSSSSTTGTTSTKEWRSKSFNAKHSATSSILSTKQPSSTSLEVPPKVIAQKSMLDKLKLFNSRPSSRASSVTSLEDPDPSPNEVNICPVHPEAHLGNQPLIMAGNSSPKLAMKGIAQRTLGRTLVPKVKAAEKDKDKMKSKAKDKTTKRCSYIEQDRIMEERVENRTETPTMADGKKSSLNPKGTKNSSNAKKEGSPQSGIPKLGQNSKASGVVKNSVAHPAGKVEPSRVFRAGVAALARKCPTENKNSTSASRLMSTEGRCSQNSSSNLTQTSSTNNIQLPQAQQSHPNTATVAPFMYRSQTDVDKTGVTEGGEGKKERSVLHSKSIHTSLESLTGEDSESRRLRTVKNIADLRQNLEETMSSLRHVTHISHSTLQTTFDACITTEISTRDSLTVTPRPVSASPWRPGTSGPRLQAGDAPSSATGFGSNKAEILEAITTDGAGYVSDGDILGRSVRMDSATSG